jgi:hypothetical protein
MRTELRRFDAVADDGEEVVIVEYQELIRGVSSVPPMPGWKSLETEDGRPVNFISELIRLASLCSSLHHFAPLKIRAEIATRAGRAQNLLPCGTGSS